MASSKETNRKVVELGSANDQLQSPLFTSLPLDIRRHIYLQLWLDCGLTQHIFTFGKSTYLQSYPCIIDADEWDKDLKTRAAEQSTEAPGPQAQDEQLQPPDDPGDIDGAIQDIAPGPEEPIHAADNSSELPGSPWCMHQTCFQRWIEKWDHSLYRAYSANYRRQANFISTRIRARDDDLRTSPLLLPLLVCKRMYQEARESMFSRLRFSFSAQDSLDRFVDDLPRELTERVQFVDVSHTLRTFLVWNGGTGLY